MSLPLADIVATSTAVAATRSRTSKVALLAEALRAAEVVEVELVADYLAGHLRQRRTGVGWRGLSDLPTPSDSPSLSVAEVDAVFEQVSQLSGSGSATQRRTAVQALFARATADEQAWVRAVVADHLRQGASDALLLEAVASAFEIPIATVRAAAMLAGSPVAVTGIAAREGAAGLEEVALQVGRAIQPMLAASAPDPEAAWAKLDRPQVAVDRKLDGIRIQAHKRGDDVLLVTRSLDDITQRLPEVAALVANLPGDELVLDGEVIAVDAAGRPRPFQETAARTASAVLEGDLVDHVPLSAFFFDLLHDHTGCLLDLPAELRFERLAAALPAEHLVPRVVASSAEEVRSAFDAHVEAGHEGIVVKDLEAPYAAGRRGSAWVKVKPVLTADLVVLAVEAGSGRRTGWLSNIHLGARDPETGGFVMLGKTFKGMTDEVLAWQTERFRQLEISDDGWVVSVRPEQVVEVAFDGLQRSSRYPGGVALRFARVLRYRDDKTADQADTLAEVKSALAPSEKS